jgi:putative phosphoesterase
MLLGVVSDTHGNLRTTRQAVARLADLEVAAVLHCGDIVGPEVISLFAAWPTHFVFGNCDHEPAELRQAIRDAGQTCHERCGELTLEGKEIALLHGDDSRRFDDLVESGAYDLVCYGHTHHYEHHRVGRTLVLNPGALHRANPHSFAVVDLGEMSVRKIPLPEHD